MSRVGTSLSLALFVASLAALWQLFVRDLLFVSFGIGRAIQGVDEFPYTCRRLQHPKLEACEDLWLDDAGRTLYAACAGTEGRLHWNPALKKVNWTGRRSGGSELIALDIDDPGEDGIFSFRAIKPSRYVSAVGDDSLDLLGFDASIVAEDTIQFYFINQRPPVDALKKVMDAAKIGVNSSIDVFELKRGDKEMHHMRTIWSPAVWAPNRVAALGNGAFLVTNDHSVKVGLRREFDPVIGGGNIAYCDRKGDCHAARNGNEREGVDRSGSTTTEFLSLFQKVLKYAPKTKLKFPNGITRGKDGLFYVPSTVDGQVRVFGIKPDNTLKQIDSIHIGMPLDNVSPDAVGDLYVPGCPSLFMCLKGLANPRDLSSPVSIWRIKRMPSVGGEDSGRSDYKVEKVIEDRDGKILSGSTTVRHDVKTGRLFVGAVLHPFLVVCDPK